MKTLVNKTFLCGKLLSNAYKITKWQFEFSTQRFAVVNNLSSLFKRTWISGIIQSSISGLFWRSNNNLNAMTKFGIMARTKMAWIISRFLGWYGAKMWVNQPFDGLKPTTKQHTQCQELSIELIVVSMSRTLCENYLKVSNIKA